MIATAPRPPPLTPTLESSEHLQCPVCLEVKPGMMVMHFDCSRLYCAEDAITIITASNPSENLCGICRLPAKHANPLMPSKFHKPIPIVQTFIDSIKYHCESCNANVKYFSAISHHQECPNRASTHRPPEHIPPRGASALVLREVISNPVVGSFNYTHRNSRLCILHFNGTQITSKFFPKNYTVRRIKSTISDLTGVTVENIKLFKFNHLELGDNEKIDLYTKVAGATYLSSFSNVDGLEASTANLVLHEVGPHPFIAPPRQPDSPIEEEW